MLGPDAVNTGEIGDRPPDLQDPVIRTRRETQPGDRRFEDLLALGAQPAELAVFLKLFTFRMTLFPPIPSDSTS
jgi:hypothetical protein